MAHEGFEDDDPMGLVGMVLPGEPGQMELMAECFIEEYVRLGWNEARLMTLFVNPLFLATHRIYRAQGEAYVRALIRRTRAKWGADRLHYPMAQPDRPPNCSLVADPATPPDSPFTA